MLHREQARRRPVATRRSSSRCARCGCRRSWARSRAAARSAWFDRPRATSLSTSTSRAVRPAGPSRRRGTRWPAAPRDGLDRVGVEPAGHDLGPQLGGGLGGRARRTVRAAARASPDRRRRRRGPAPGARSPRPLSPRGYPEPSRRSRCCDRDRAQRRERLGLLEHALGQVGVQAHPLPFAGAERPRLVPDRVRDPQPAEVVNQPGTAQRAHARPPSRPSCVARGGGEIGHGARMPEAVGRLEIDEVRDRQSARRRTAPRRARRRAPAPRRSPRPRSSTASRSPRIRSRRLRTGSAAQPGSNCLPLRLRASSVAAATPPTRWATSTNSASCASRAASGICSPANLPGQPLPSHVS